MCRISSRWTFIQKKVFPLLLFGSLALFVLMVSLEMIRRHRVDPTFYIVSAIMAGVWYVILKMFVLNLADEVWDADDALIIKNKGQEERIPLSEIMNVSYSVHVNPTRVAFMLHRPGRFGREVSFSPEVSWNPFARNPLIEELITRIDACRRG
jgi:hypothetical protein